jgi:hypothetical protein
MLLKKSALAAITTIIILSGILTGCNTGAVTTTTSTTASPYQQIAHQLKAIQPYEVPANLIPVGGQKQGNEFDVNKIFSVLTHLSMQEGYVLDYVYLSDGSQGGPILYSRPLNLTPFATYEEYREATHSYPRPDNDFSMIWLVEGAGTNAFGNKIKVDGTAEGYYEYALLQGLANQFYLLGNARVNDRSVIADSSELESVLTGIENSGNWTKIDNTFKKNARKIELKPVIQIGETNVLVQVVLFTKWGGFLRLSTLMSRDYPHTVISTSLETILLYDCGIKPKDFNSGNK